MNEIKNTKIKKLFNHFQSANYEYVIRECKTILKKFPESPAILNMLGLSLQQIGDYESAKTSYLKTIQFNPQHYAALNNLGTICKTMEDFKSSEKYFLQALKIKPGYIHALSNYANLKREINDFDEAINLYTKALEVDQNQFVIHHNLALTYQGIGKFDLAKKHSLKSLEINPNHVICHKMLSINNKYIDENDNHFKLMKDKLKDENLTKDSKITLNFSISKAYEDMSNFDNAFNHMLIGNDLNRSKIKYNIEKDIELFRQIKDKFSAFNFNKKNNENFESKKIIFICGMPRSGTTLTEQIISTHKNVFGAGELDYLTTIINDELFEDQKLIEKKVIDIANESNIIFEKYFDLLNNFKFDTPMITDKAPLNFKWIGFIKIFFPNSKIILCQRDSRNNCLSLYKNVFESELLNWCYDLDQLIDYYNNIYLEYIKLWKDNLGDFIYTVKYENLINNQKEETQKLLKFCDLDWDPNCLEYYKNNKTPIATASVNQANKPIYSTSKDLYKNYKIFLEDKFKFLKH